MRETQKACGRQTCGRQTCGRQTCGRLSSVVAFFVAALILAPAAQADWPAWMDRWLFNAEERTQRGTASLESRDYSQAAASMDTAMRLAPEDATAKFNAGTARLPVAPEEGRRLLEAAGSQTEDPNLTSLAHYNAGSSYLEAGELETAIESFKQSLRHNPDSEDAKFNLELAQKRLKEQQQEQQDQDQDQQDQDQRDQDQDQDQQDQDQQDQDQQDQDQQDQDQQDQEQDPENQESDEEKQDQDSEDQENQDSKDQEQKEQEEKQGQDQDQQESGDQNQEQKEDPLPQFSDLPDMNAEEAAAILEAIENMEREQRRQEALEAAKAGIGGKKDW